MNDDPQPHTEQEPGDLGLSAERWLDLQYAFNFGLLEPDEGTIEEQAFRRMDTYVREEANRAAREREREQATSPERQAEAGGPEPEAGIS